MSTSYTLVNHTKREWVLYAHINASTQRELAGCPAAAAITTWYLLQNRGDRIAFVSDTYDDWPFPEGSRADRNTYREVTDDVVAGLVAAGILRDDGYLWRDDDEPETVYICDLKNVWEPGG